MPTVGIVAGEASGDLLGSHLIRALKKHRPDFEFIGIAGPKMMAEGAKSLHPMEHLSVSGYFEVLRHLPKLLKIRSHITHYFIQNPPDIFIGIDAPDFNFTVESKLKSHNIKTIHYVSPSVWAWRKGRINKIRRSVSHILSLFPFEPALYQKAGVNVSYVGHPLADILPVEPNTQQARESLKLKPERLVVALLPGSRKSEVRQLDSLFVKAAHYITQQRPDAQFLVPLITHETKAIFEQSMYEHFAALQKSNPDVTLPAIQILFGHAHMALEASDVAIVASGTATLEAALLKRPMVITYKMPWLSWHIIKRMNYLPYVGLPNVLAGKFIVPELLQKDATPEKLAEAALALISDKKGLDEIKAEFTRMHLSLRQNTEEKAAQVILGYL